MLKQKMSDWEKYLRDIYVDPAHPASFSNPQTLYKVATRSPGALCRAVFVFLCILNVVVIFYYIFINVQLLWLLHSIGPSP